MGELQDFLLYVRDLIQSVRWTDGIPTVIGALVGGYATLIAARQSFKHQREILAQQSFDFEKSFLQAIASELKVVFDHYHKTIGREIERADSDQPFDLFFPVTHDPLTVYNNNTQSLGLVRDDNLRHSIIAAYTVMKSLLDSYDCNNSMIKEYEKSQHIPAPFGKSKFHSREHQIEYTKALKEAHEEAKASVAQVTEAIGIKLSDKSYWSFAR